MAKRRLSNDRRLQIKAFICDKVRASTLAPYIEATKTAHDRWEANLVSVLKFSYPQSDMKVLDKYGQATRREYLTITVDHGPDKSHEHLLRLCQPEGTLLPKNESTTIVHIKAGCELHKAWLRYDRLRNVQKLKQREVMNDYHAVIYSAKTFEGLIEILPEVEPMGATLWNPGTAVMNISDEVLARVAADQRARAA